MILNKRGLKILLMTHDEHSLILLFVTNPVLSRNLLVLIATCIKAVDIQYAEVIDKIDFSEKSILQICVRKLQQAE